MHGSLDLPDCYSISSEVDLILPNGSIRARELLPHLHLLSSINPKQTLPIAEFDCQNTVTGDFELYGINGETCFFTGTQVFITSTGPRALNPTAAKSTLRGIEIGQLQIGHVLYRLDQTHTSHEFVTISSIEKYHGESKCSMVAFENGSSTFYANGFLVMSMQPDMALVSTAKALSGLSDSQKIHCLRENHELDSQFARIGTDGVTRVLRHELDHVTSLKGAQPRGRPPSAFNLLNAKKSYRLEPYGGDNLDVPDYSYSLPRISLFEGVLRVDGQVQLNASIDNEKSEIQWNRQVSDKFFEHGCLNMFDHSLNGNGVVVINSLPFSSTISPSSGAQYARVVVKKDTPRPRASRSQFGDGHEDQYQMILDKDRWPKTELARQSPKSPEAFGTLIFETENIGGEEGLEIPAVKIPVLDQLCMAINSVADPDMPLNTLYSSAMTMTDRSDFVVNVKLDNADVIASLADQFSLESPFDLTFRDKLKCDVTLPILFQEFELKLVENQLVGAAYEFNPLMRGCMGERHLFVSSRQQHKEALALRLENHQIIGSVLPMTGLTLQAVPSKDTSFSLRGLCVQDLLSLKGYNEPAIHDTSQKLIQNAMLYHMDDYDRKTLLQIPEKPSVPNDLPRELGESLDGKIKTWIRKVYAPAVVATQMSRIDAASTSSWRYNFTAQEKMRLNYFWTGKGKTCLSKQKEYNDLSEIASRCAMEKLCPRIKEYELDGAVWAGKMIECITDPRYLRSMRLSPLEGGASHNNKVSNILSALDINGHHVKDFSIAVLNNTIGETFNAPVIGNDSTIADSPTKQFVFDAWKILVRSALSPDSHSQLDPAFVQDLVSEVLAIEKLGGLDSAATIDKRVDSIMAYQQPFLSELCIYMNASFDTKPTIPNLRSEGDDTTSQLRRCTRGFSWAATKATLAPKFAWFTAEGSSQASICFLIMTIVNAGKLLYQTISGIIDIDSIGAAAKASITTRVLSAITSGLRFGQKTWITIRTFLVRLEEPMFRHRMSGLDYWVGQALVNLRESLGGFIQRCQVKLCSLLTALPNSTASFMEQIAETIKNAALKVIPGWTKKVFSQFNLSEKLLNSLGMLLDAVLVITWSLQLRDTWNDMNTFDKTMNVIQIGVLGLSVFFSTAFADMLVFLGVFTASDAVVAAIPVVGTVLAVAGIVLMVITAFIDWLLQREEPVPLNPYEAFIKDHGQPMIRQWLDQPPQLLQYEVPTSVSWTSGRIRSTSTFTITAYNRSERVVKLANISISLTCGSTKAALFSNKSFEIVEKMNSRRYADGHICLDNGDDVQVRLVENIQAADTTMFDLQVLGIPSDQDSSGRFKVWPGRVIRLVVVGTLADVDVVSVKIVETLVEPDTSYQYFQVHGVKLA